MLQIALWVQAISRGDNHPFPTDSHQRLALATRWLLALLDPVSGGVPNLGPNDGAYLQQLSACPFYDYRPVLQAAASAFLDERPFLPGPWDELPLWLGDNRQGLEQETDKSSHLPLSPDSLTPNSVTPNSLIPDFLTSPPLSPIPLSPYSLIPHVLRITNHASWAYLRAARFHSRPGHADQLHLDLWWRGLNLAQDAGSYSYNAPPPWENALSRTSAHNTLAVNGRDQMTRAGRFLWLDWAQARIIAHERADDGSWERLVAQHDGYRRLGLLHQRSVTALYDSRWLVEDSVLQVGKSHVGSTKRSISTLNFKPSTFNLYWLLPDWEWEIGEKGESRVEISILSPYGKVVLEIDAGGRASLAGVQLVRAGQVLYGSGDAPAFLGWVSPTYAHKVPALSLNVAATGAPPFSLTTTWLLPTDQDHQ
jgi:hypothetical protein